MRGATTGGARRSGRRRAPALDSACSSSPASGPGRSAGSPRSIRRRRSWIRFFAGASAAPVGQPVRRCSVAPPAACFARRTWPDCRVDGPRQEQRRHAVPVHLPKLGGPALPGRSRRDTDLEGARFLIGGEPITSARLGGVRRSGANALPRYGTHGGRPGRLRLSRAAGSRRRSPAGRPPGGHPGPAADQVGARVPRRRRFSSRHFTLFAVRDDQRLDGRPGRRR